MEVIEAHPFHVTRDADIAIKELEAEDLLETIEEGVRQRRFGSVVRLMVGEDMPAHILDILMNNLEMEASQVYRVRGPLSLSRLMHLYALDRPDLKDVAVPARHAKAAGRGHRRRGVFALIRRQDILLHHPFESFQPVVDFLKKAARDPNVLAIKMVLYRIGRNSPIVEALLEANEEGKQVAVLVELKARFDEESNIEWARALEREGVHVVYGLLGLKTHCKVLMVVRREAGAHPPLYASGHRQLQRGHGASLHRHRHVDLRRGSGRRRHRPVQLPDRILGQDRLQKAAGFAGEPARSALKP